jgi:uridine kinase
MDPNQSTLPPVEDIRDRLRNANPFSFVGTLAADALRLIEQMERDMDELGNHYEEVLAQSEFYRRAYASGISLAEQARRLFEAEVKKCYLVERELEKLKAEMEATDGHEQAG